MPLSEHEQRQLEQIEQALYREDRRLGRLVRSSDPRVHYKRRILQSAIGFLVGCGLVAAAALTPYVWLAAGGFTIMLLCAILALSSWRRVAGLSLRVANPDGTVRPRKGRKGRKAPQKGRGSMMERLDERWRRRQERDW